MLNGQNTLSAYSDAELVQELSTRGYSILLPIEAPEMLAVEWPNLEVPDQTTSFIEWE